jgi:hypothetical protein
MKKLLLIILVPFLVLGCNNIDADVQTDEKIQGAWLFEEGDYTLYINAAQLVVKYMTDVSTPYRTEFSYSAEGAGGRYYGGTSPWQGIEIYTGEVETILGEMTLFSYKDDVEIATIYLGLTIEEQYKNNILTIYDIDFSEEEFYYSDAIPKIGDYINLYEGTGGGGKRPKPPVEPPERTTSPKQFRLFYQSVFPPSFFSIETEPDEYGFTVTGADTNEALLTYRINMGPYTLKDVASVEFNYTAIAGDSNNKDINFFAAALGGLPTAPLFTVSDYSLGSVASGNASSEKKLKIELNETKAAAVSGSIIEIAFFINATKTGSDSLDTKYSVKNIIFNVYDD